MNLLTQINKEVDRLEGPIVVFGAGGFIGANLFRTILAKRNDVYAVTSKPFVPWRLDDLDQSRILQCDITKRAEVAHLFDEYRFRTIFDLAAYGAYAKQDNVERIYDTNVMGLLHLVEEASKYNIRAFIHAGSSSEYGLNCEAPDEEDTLMPNSHYSVTKVSAAYLIRYYGILKEMPVVNLRYYSIYGPYEEPDRLVPQLIQKGMQGGYPVLVQPDISRDFVYIDDAIWATLLAANAPMDEVRGRSINIASGAKTTLRAIVEEIRTLFGIEQAPEWGSMPNRKWDLKDWYGKATLAEKLLGWKNQTLLGPGLQQTREWQEKYSYPLYEKKLIQDKIRHKLTAVIACYKDAQAIPIMYQRLTATFKKINVDYEIIFVNDCSPDNTMEVLMPIVQQDDHVIAIEHSRNFGSQAAFLSGMEIATGDGVILLDGDLQDPPELIEDFCRVWEEGNDVVYGRRVKRDGNQRLAFFYKVFYRIFRGIAYVPIPLDAGDFSLMDRKVVDELIKLPETDQFLRGLRAWVGFKQVGVDYVRPERMFGVTTNNWRKNIGWARKAIFSFSFVPLELLTYLGGFLTVLSFIAIIAQIIAYFVLPGIPHGITTIVVLILFFGGLNMLGIALIGEYQGKILEEAKKRPKFIRKNIYTKK
ncbi:NAD-dependent epimerase/dehydratase family protein [Taibaiella koreensis]|uniref:NAD-dependent epimerase/dehydratase family protein n=1 Tax=Taibaiella koreensis TaxID=1268548 RepID=UPI001F08C75B|nr:NAD-dependent epimerase/dehydratase family protein [Taibaiella koreensis]